MPSKQVTGSYGQVTSLLEVGAVERLDTWRQSTLRGFDKILRSYLYEDLDYHQVVGRFEDITTGSYDQINQLEDEERTKIGPFSIRLPWSERVESVSAFYVGRDWSPSSSALARALADLKSLVPSRSLRSLSLEEAFERLPRHKQSGLPAYSNDEEALQPYLSRAKRILRKDEGERFLWPAVAGWRGQAGGPNRTDVKQRLVWMYDKVDAILGLRYLHPILDTLRDKPMFSAWNNLDHVDEVMTGMLTEAERRGVNVYSTDYSGFDASLSPIFIQSTIDIIKSWFPQEEEFVIQLIADNLMTLGVLTPVGVSASRDGGMPSGTVFTNLIDTMVNFVASRYAAYRNGVSHVGLSVLGDDAVNIYSPDPGLEDVVGAVSELGLSQNEDKQYVDGRSLHYLQRVHLLDYQVKGVSVGVRSLNRTLSGMVNYERPRSGVGLPFAISRNIMQMENAKWHPGFDEFVRRVVGDNRVILRHKPNEWFKLAGGHGVVFNKLGLDSFRYTSQTEVSRFRTIRVIGEMT